MADVNHMSFDQSNCPSCLHIYVLPIGKSLMDKHKHNTAVRKIHTEQMTVWNKHSSSRRVPRPKAGIIYTQELACMCTRMHCLNRIDGAGCFRCKDACSNAIQAGRDDRPFFYTNFECTCIICTCQCSVLFFRHDGKKLAIQARKAREEKYNTSSQTKMDRFLGFTDSILVKTKEIYQEMGDKGTVDNAMSIAALDLFSSKSVQENVGLRNDMQKEMGPLSPFVGGKNISEFRANKRKNKSIYTSGSHLPPAELPLLQDDRKMAAITEVETKNNGSIISVITPNTPNRPNSRWFRNDLIEPNPLLQTPEREVSSVGTDDITPRSAHKKRVMRRLVDCKISPSNDAKKKLFRKLVANDVKSLAIIECAIDMESSVEETKEMLLNNCT